MNLRNTLGLLVVLVSTQAFGFTIDGDLSDWGVVVADNNRSTYNFASNIGLLGSFTEDTDDRAGHSFTVGPNQGGQDYDGEMMAVAYNAGTIYIAIVTGQRPDNGCQYFGPGDIRIEAGGVRYGIEVGGGAGGQNGSAIRTGATGSTYTLNHDGDTRSHSNAAAAQTAGTIWTNATWLNDPIAPYGPVQMTINGSSTQAGVANYVYTRNSVTSQHSIIELAFDASILGKNSTASFHWRPCCGNDELDVVTANLPVPEPVTMVLLLAGGLMFRKRRQ